MYEAHNVKEKFKSDPVQLCDLEIVQNLLILADSFESENMLMKSQT
jgi:hypothetical protein